MWKKIEMAHNTFSLIFLLALLCPSLGDKQVYGSSSYRLSRGGYSTTTNTLLIAGKYDFGRDTPESDFGGDTLESDYARMMSNVVSNIMSKGGMLFAYSEKTDSLTYLSLPSTITGPFDFAWIPGQAAFVVSLGDRMILYQKDSTGDDYAGTAIGCPIDFMYIYCSCSPDGKWLAVNCIDLSKIGSNRLGLFEYEQQKFVLTNLNIDNNFLVWKDDGLLYATNKDKVLIVELKANEPRVVRTIPLKGSMLFYDIFDDRPLFQTDEGIRLGNKTLVELDQPGAQSRVATTNTAILVSASPTNLVVFDHSGHEVDRINPGNIIHFGPQKDRNTVYGLADNTLLRVSVENKTVNIHTVCDLDNAQFIIPKQFNPKEETYLEDED